MWVGGSLERDGRRRLCAEEPVRGVADVERPRWHESGAESLCVGEGGRSCPSHRAQPGATGVDGRRGRERPPRFRQGTDSGRRTSKSQSFQKLSDAEGWRTSQLATYRTIWARKRGQECPYNSAYLLTQRREKGRNRPEQGYISLRNAPTGRNPAGIVA